MPKLSVIVPVYNTENYLRECVDSVLAQTLPELEIILVDDGSKDNSGAICDEYAAKHERVTVIHQKNGGVSAARRTGVAAAKGEYIAFVDSDDWIEPDMYAQMLDCVREYDADAVLCDILFESGKEGIVRDNDVPTGLYCGADLEKIYGIMLFRYEQERPGILPSLCSKILRRDVVERVLFDVDSSIVFGEDGLCSYPSLLDSKRIYVLHRAFYHYRNNMASTSNSYDPQRMGKNLLLAEEFERQFKQRNVKMERQLNGYVARCSLECIRNELLNRSASLRARRKAVKKYLSDPVVKKALVAARKEIADRKSAFKLWLAYNRQITVLHLLFHLKQRVLLREERNG